jgi:hypothetical protein
VQAQHPGWTFQQSWDYAEAAYPALVKSSTVQENRITVKQAPQKEKEEREEFARVEGIE